MALGAVTQAEAAVIIQPQSASTDLGVRDSFVIDNAINQSGLSVGYISGVTDFDAYLAGDPEHAAGESWIAADPAPGSITFDLGSVFNLDGMAMWGPGTLLDVRNFELFASSTGDVDSFTSLGSFLQDPRPPIGSPNTAEVFDFDAT
ncbi:MAG: PEP-CTERM sorting domain-containing protein, partial [Verrucomicrobiota bacterium]